MVQAKQNSAIWAGLSLVGLLLVAGHAQAQSDPEAFDSGLDPKAPQSKFQAGQPEENALQDPAVPDEQAATPPVQQPSPPLSRHPHSPPPKAAPSAGKAWPDADEASDQAAIGSVETCEALTFPLAFLPGVGSVVSTIASYVCLVPGVLAVDYVQTFHGTRASHLWQGAVALVLAKLFADFVMKYPVLVIVGGVTVGYLAAVSLGLFVLPAFVPALAVAPFFTPVAIGGLLTVSGLTWMLMRKARKKATEWVFSLTYRLLTHQQPPQMRKAAQRNATIKPPLGKWTRAWALMAAAAGTEADHKAIHWVPVIGPFLKERSRGRNMETSIRRVRDDVLHEKVGNLEGAATMGRVMGTVEGVMLGTSQALLLAGGALFLVGTTFAALEFNGTGEIGSYAAVATTAGVASAVIGGTGLALVAARTVPKALRPFLVPLAYGLFSNGLASDEAREDGNSE